MDYTNIKNFIFYKIVGTDSWEVLTMFGKPFTSLNDAILFVRCTYKDFGINSIGLATYDQMLLNSIMWDNL